MSIIFWQDSPLVGLQPSFPIPTWSTSNKNMLLGTTAHSKDKNLQPKLRGFYKTNHNCYR